MRRIKMPQLLEGERSVCPAPAENRELYYGLQLALLRSLKNEGLISQVQFELCEKTLFEQKYGIQ